MEYLFCFCVFYKFPQWLLTAGGGGAGAGRPLWPESIWCPSLIIDVTTGVYILTAPPSIITHPLYGHPLPPTVVKLKIEKIIEKVPFKFRKFSISDLIDIWVFEQSAMSVRHIIPGFSLEMYVSKRSVWAGVRRGQLYHCWLGSPPVLCTATWSGVETGPHLTTLSIQSVFHLHNICSITYNRR